VTFFVSIATFNGYASFSYTKPMGLFIVLLLFPIICVAIYVVSQLILVIRTLDDRWVSSLSLPSFLRWGSLDGRSWTDRMSFLDLSGSSGVCWRMES